MLTQFFSLIKGTYIMKVEGRFPERLLNIASSKGIFVYSVCKSQDGKLLFSVSKKAGDKLLSLVPEDLTVQIKEKYGLPFFVKKYRQRIVLFLLPAIFLLFSAIFSSFIWRVDISGGDNNLHPIVRQELRNNGVYVGAIKYKISQNDVKRNCILKINKLSWLWVDIKGTTAYVRLHQKTDVPETEKITEPADVISTQNGVIESMQTFRGIPLVSVGETVEKGQVIISGVLQSEKENIPIYFHHASGKVIARVWEEKTVNIPKFSYDKTPTGRKKSVYGIKIKKNKLNFSINSGISYKEYDKIENKVKIPFLPIELFRTDFNEVNVKTNENDLASQLKKHREELKKKLESEAEQIVGITASQEDMGDFIRVKFTAECLMRIDKEIPINKGDYYGENN